VAEEERLVLWEEGQRPFLRRSRQVARAVQNELNRIFETENEVATARLGVLAPIRAPAIVVESGFLTNPEDLSRLESPDFQKEIAGGISRAIIPFLR
jgi:N-acetylmuramoyl-L-alanine amidase